jgi:hypothetical protein
MIGIFRNTPRFLQQIQGYKTDGIEQVGQKKLFVVGMGESQFSASIRPARIADSRAF